MKIILERKIFSSVWLHFKNYIRKQFSVFDNILKMLFFYKFFTFSQFPNKFYITKFTTTHTSAPTENPPPPTHQHPQKIHYYPHKTRHHPHHHNNNKKKIRDQREKAYRRWDWPRGEDRSASGGWRDRPRGGRDRSSSGRLHVARSWRREVDGVISPACLVAWSRSLSLSLSLHIWVRKWFEMKIET